MTYLDHVRFEFERISTKDRWTVFGAAITPIIASAIGITIGFFVAPFLGASLVAGMVAGGFIGGFAGVSNVAGRFFTAPTVENYSFPKHDVRAAANMLTGSARCALKGIKYPFNKLSARTPAIKAAPKNRMIPQP